MFRWSLLYASLLGIALVCWLMYFSDTTGVRGYEGRTWAVDSFAGGLKFLLYPEKLAVEHPAGFRSRSWEEFEPDRNAEAMFRGFHDESWDFGNVHIYHNRASLWLIDIPYSLLNELLVLPLGIALLLIVRHRMKISKNRGVDICRNCGYNLRSHKHGDKCPECGTTIVKPIGLPTTQIAKDRESP